MMRTFAHAQADLQEELALEADQGKRLRKIYSEFESEIRRLRHESADSKLYAHLSTCILNLRNFYRHDGSLRKDGELRVGYGRLLVFVRDDVILREQVARIIEYLELVVEPALKEPSSDDADGDEFRPFYYGVMNFRRDDARRAAVGSHAYSYLLAVLIRLDLRSDDVIACRVDGPDTLGPLRDVLVGAPPAHAWVATIAACFHSEIWKASQEAPTCVRTYTAHAMAAQATIQRACYVLSLRPMHADGDAFSAHIPPKIARNLTMLQTMGCEIPFRTPYAIAAAALKFDASNHLLLALLLAERREEASISPIDGVATTCMPSGAMLTEVILGSMSASAIRSGPTSKLNHEAIMSCCLGLMQHPLLLAALPTTYSVFNGTIANALSMLSTVYGRSCNCFYRDEVVNLTILFDFDSYSIKKNSRVLFLPPWSPVGVPRCAWTDVPFVRTCMPFAGANDAIYQREAERPASKDHIPGWNMVLTHPHTLGPDARRESDRLCAAADATWLALSPYTPHWMTQSIEALHANWGVDTRITIDAAIEMMYVHARHKKPDEVDSFSAPARAELSERIALELSLARSPPPSLMSAMYDISVRAQSLTSEIEQIVCVAPQLDPGRLIDMSVAAWSASDMYRYVYGGKLDALRAAYAAITHAQSLTQAQAQALANAHAHARAAVPIDATMSVA